MARLVGRTRANYYWLILAVAGALLVLLLALLLLSGQAAPGVSGSMGV